MRSTQLARTVVLALGVFMARGAFAQEALDAVTLEVEVDGHSIDADKLLELWSKKLAIPLIVDQQMAGTKMRLQSGPISWGAFKHELDFYDIVIERKDVAGVPGASLLFAHLRRNLPCKAGPPYPFVAPDQLASHGDEIVTTTIKVENGSANDIFATVRGLLVRDVNRIGNILYVRGPETIILVDFASNADYYARVIRALDVPGAATHVFHLDHANAEDAALALEPLAEAGTRIVPSPRTNQLIVKGSRAEVAKFQDLVQKIDVATESLRPRFRSETPGVALWKIATAFAFVAFVGQTILLRRFQRRLRLTKLPV